MMKAITAPKPAMKKPVHRARFPPRNEASVIKVSEGQKGVFSSKEGTYNSQP